MTRLNRRNATKAFALAVGGVLTLGTWSAHAADDSKDDELRIGVITSLTGPAAAFGIPERDTIKYLIEQVNKSGGINGRKVAMFSKDDQTNPTVAASMARDLILNDKVHVIFGPTTGSGALAAAPIAARNKVPMLSPASTIGVTAKDSGFYDWVFRSCYNQAAEIDTVFDYIKNKGYKSIGLFFQQDAYGEAAAQHLRTLVGTDSMVKVVAEASAPLSASDLSVHATKLVGAKPDVILIQSDIPAGGAALVRGLAQAQSTVPVLVVGALANQQAFLTTAGEDARGIIAPFGGIGWDKPTPAQAKFIENYGQPKNFGEALAGTGFMAIEAAVSKVKGKLTGESLRNALENLCPFPSLMRSDGCYSKEDHDGSFKTAPVEMVDGKWVTIE